MKLIKDLYFVYKMRERIFTSVTIKDGIRFMGILRDLPEWLRKVVIFLWLRN